jgi:hypothetical protein
VAAIAGCGRALYDPVSDAAVDAPRGAPTELTPDWGAQPLRQRGALLGQAVASADVNCDGVDDVIVGAPGFSRESAGEGAVLVFLGSAGAMAELPYWTLDPADQVGAAFGTAVTSLGDLDGDGCDDFAVGAPLEDGGGADSGRVYVYRGGVGVPGMPTVLDGEGRGGAHFGNAVASAGDVRGDGSLGLLVGAPYWTGEARAEGRAYLFLTEGGRIAGPPDWTDDPTDQVQADYATSVAGVGDVDGDGRDDVVVGAYSFTGEAESEGRAYLYRGTPTGLTTDPTWTADPLNTVEARFGAVVAGAGDVDRDGFADVVLGSWSYDGASPREGRAFVLGGPQLDVATRLELLSPGGTNAGFGYAVVGMGDFDGDGFDDVAVSGFGLGEVSQEGGALIFLGGAGGLDPSPAFTSSPLDEDTAQYGIAIAAGDVNDDGRADLVVGAHLDDGDAADEGAVYVLLGRASRRD